MFVVVRIVVHTVMIAGLLFASDWVFGHFHVPVAEWLLDRVRVGAFLVYASTVAGLINRRPYFLALVYFLVLTLVAHTILVNLFDCVVAVAFGVATAFVVLLLAREAFPPTPTPEEKE